MSVYEVLVCIPVLMVIFGVLWRAYFWLINMNLFMKPEVTKLSDHLPFDYVKESNQSVCSYDGVCVKILKIHGIDSSIMTDEALVELQMRKRSWLNELAKNKIETRVFSIRDKVSVDLNGSYDNSVLQEIHDVWMGEFKDNFVNSHFVMFSIRKKGSGFVDKVKDLASKYFGHVDVSASSETALNESVERTMELLPEFGVSELSVNSDGYDNVIAFLSRLTRGKKTNGFKSKENVKAQISGSAVEFSLDDGFMTYVDGSEKKYSALLSLKAFGESVSSDMVDEILSMPCEMMVVHNFIGCDKQQSKAKVLSKYSDEKIFGLSKSSEEQFAIAFDEIDSGSVTLFKYQLHFQIESNSIQELNNLVKHVKQRFAETEGSQLIQETHAIDKLWYSMFPSCQSMIRAFEPFSSNVATLLQFHNEYQGNLSSDWGRGPVRMLKTMTGAPHFFTFHVNEDKESLGHTLMVGVSGKGKTSLLQHLIGGVMRFPDVNVYAMDRNHGMLVFTEACGGIQANVSHEPVINPLVLDDTDINRTFLNTFLEGLVKCHDNVSKKHIQSAVDIIFSLPKGKRILTNIVDEIFPKNSDVRIAMEHWVGAGKYGKWFNGAINAGRQEKVAYNALDLSSSRFITFEMAEALKDDELCMNMCYFLFHMINSHVTYHSSPHAIFIDEANKMLRHPYFRQHTSDMLEEQRKKRGVLGLMFQTPDKIEETGISKTILGHCRTKFFFRNPDAKPSDFEMFNLTDSEMAFVQNKNKIAKRLPHAVLMKKEDKSVILDVNLKPLGKYIDIYKSGTEAIQRMTTLKIDESDKGFWVEKYLEAL